MKKFLKNYWALFIPILILVITGIYILVKNSGTADSQIRIVGMVDAEFVDVSSALPGRLDSLKVYEGQKVHAGEVIAVMQSEKIETLRQQAIDAVRIAKSSEEIVERGVAPEVLAAAENIQKIAEDQMELMENTYRRFKNLYAEGVVSGQEYELVKFRYQAAQKELENAKLNAQLLKKGSNEQMKTKADALLNQAKNAQKLSEQIKEEAQIKAPVTGVVASVIAHKGEMVNAGYPMLTIRKENSYFISFNIRQDLISKIKKGMEVQVKIPGVTPEQIQAKVVDIESAMGYADFVPENQKGQFQLRTFKIKCAPLNTESLKGLFVGMTAQLILPQ